MSEIRTLLERKQTELHAPAGSFERLLRRRDRKRRNQRIAAGVVGIAVFVAALWIVTSGLSLDRSERSVAPAGEVTGPAETGPAETGPVVTGPARSGPSNPYSVGFKGVPPGGASPSEPLSGELVMSDGGIHPYFAVHVYADGRLIWARDASFTGEFTPSPKPEGGPVVSAWIQQRLTPEGVELLRSGAVPLGGQFENPGAQLPRSAWWDVDGVGVRSGRQLRPYVPSKYAACLMGGFEPPYRALDLLPAWAQDLLRRTDRLVKDTGCQEVTIEDARALVEVLRDAGFEQGQVGGTGWVGSVLVFKGTNVGGSNFKGSGIEFVPLLPDGYVYMTGG
jgi:hypothetical protein